MATNLCEIKFLLSRYDNSGQIVFKDVKIEYGLLLIFPETFLKTNYVMNDCKIVKSVWWLLKTKLRVVKCNSFIFLCKITRYVFTGKRTHNSLYLQYINIIYFILTNSECSFLLFSNMYSNMFSNMYCVIRLTHFSPVSHFYTRWKRQKTKVFLTFSRGIEMWH